MGNNFFLTGAGGLGKSAMIQQLLSDLGVCPSGFLTLPYFIEGEMRGHYFHSLVAVDPEKNNMPVSLIYGRENNIPLTRIFDGVAADCLKQSREDDSPLIVMDGLGSLEDSALFFQRQVQICLDSDKPVLGVLNHGESPFIDSLCHRPDLVLFDLDKGSKEEAFRELSETLRKIF